ncbi:hypothetical protein GCM10011391_18530 [Pullulanibacillus camelliae]|uniref:CwlT-like lysozyme domain-containing protein n=1 Tax=Pullulanibacillus camelliae TaxID=1707096 RepID=A0A8J2VN96_9BACL|nr:lysozyme family protein [Pullulanibacillus camelliae]GGE40029.1 hypothetical protein GCM10011391_18530 [Pullulanibacillus camelliae]
MTTLTHATQKQSESHLFTRQLTRIFFVTIIASYCFVLLFIYWGTRSDFMQKHLETMHWKPTTIMYEIFGNENIYFAHEVAKSERPPSIFSSLFHTITLIDLGDLTSLLKSQFAALALINSAKENDGRLQYESPVPLNSILEQFFQQLSTEKSPSVTAMTSISYKGVETYQSLLEKDLRKYDLEEYTPILMALMEQESKGKGGDPMQASESAGLKPNSIKDPNKSIEQGVKYFHRVLLLGEEKGVDFKTILQSYNMGVGYISYVAKHGGHQSTRQAIFN